MDVRVDHVSRLILCGGLWFVVNTLISARGGSHCGKAGRQQYHELDALTSRDTLIAVKMLSQCKIRIKSLSGK